MKTSTNTVPQMARNADTGAADRLLRQVVPKAALRDGRLRNWHPGDEEDQPPFVDLVGPPGWESQILWTEGRCKIASLLRFPNRPCKKAPFREHQKLRKGLRFEQHILQRGSVSGRVQILRKGIVLNTFDKGAPFREHKKLRKGLRVEQHILQRGSVSGKVQILRKGFVCNYFTKGLRFGD